MMLSETDIKDLCNIAIDAAIKAGSLIEMYADKNIRVNYKGAALGTSPQGGTSEASQVVTEVDLLSQETILRLLKPTFEKYNLALLTEELIDDKSRFEKDYFWCIDPLDGTLPFTEGVEGYSVSIALVAKNGIPVIGVIYDPKNDNLYHSYKNGGAYKNHEIITLTQNSNLPFYFITDRSFIRDRNYKEVELRLKQFAIEAGAESFHVIKDMGAAMNAIFVLEKQNACYFKFPKEEVGGGSIWDFAASCCIFNELNAIATTYNSDTLPLNKTNTTFMNDCGIIYAPCENIALLIKPLYKQMQNLKW